MLQGDVTMKVYYNKPKSNCFLYSVNTYLAHYINEKFYMGTHYVWCSPCFDSENNPPSSNPKEIFLGLFEDVRREDVHSAKVQQNKLGLIKGAEIMLQKGIITKKEREEILVMIHDASIRSFSPLIYVIDQSKVHSKAYPVPVKEKANLFSEEYFIYDLNSDEFDTISL